MKYLKGCSVLFGLLLALFVMQLRNDINSFNVVVPDKVYVKFDDMEKSLTGTFTMRNISNMNFNIIGSHVEGVDARIQGIPFLLNKGEEKRLTILLSEFSVISSKRVRIIFFVEKKGSYPITIEFQNERGLIP